VTANLSRLAAAAGPYLITVLLIMEIPFFESILEILGKLWMYLKCEPGVELKADLVSNLVISELKS
jgi:hypothetical protein